MRSPNTWRRLTFELDRLNPESEALVAAVFEADATLEDWPDPLRCAPLHWLPTSSSSTISWCWELVRSLEVAPSIWSMLPRWTGFDRVRALSFRGRPLSLAVLSKVLGRPDLHCVVELDLVDGDLDDRLVSELLNAPSWNKLRGLSVQGNALSAPALSRLVTHLPPSIESLELSVDEERWPLNLEDHWSHAAPLRRLGLHAATINAHTVETLLRRRNLPGLEHLRLRQCTIDDSGFEALVNEALPGLEWLDLDHCALPKRFDGSSSDHVLKTLSLRGTLILSRPGWINTHHLRLTDLDLGHTRMSVESLSWVLGLRTTSSLKRLNVDGIPLATCFEDIMQGERSDTLEALSLARCGLGATSDLSRLGHACTLRELNLSNNELDARVIESFWIPFVSRQRESRLDLDVSGNPIGDSGAEVLSPSMQALHTLRMACCGLSSAGATRLVTSACEAGASALILDGNALDGLDPKVWRTLSTSKLHTLSMTNCGLDDAQVVDLGKLDAFARLVSLNLAANPVSLEGLVAMAVTGGLQCMRMLTLSGISFEDLVAVLSPHPSWWPSLKAVRLDGHDFLVPPRSGIRGATQ